MKAQTHKIPWGNPHEWQDVLAFFRTVDRVHAKDLAAIRDTGSAILDLYRDLSQPMEALCLAACPGCLDICCERATIWYDFKDLIYLYFTLGNLPASQIDKTRAGHGRSACRHLTRTGCSLPRSQRPFVCTWYICSPQKQIIYSSAGQRRQTIFRKLEAIKGLRNRMEEDLCRFTAGG